MTHSPSTQTASRGVLSDWSLSAVAVGLSAVLISYAGSLVVSFQAAQAAHVSDVMVALWAWAISIGATVSGTYASWWWKAPVVTVRSALRTTLLVSLFPGLSLNEAVGAYITVAVVILLIGVSGTFDRLMRLIPKGTATGMMVGILLQFDTHAFAVASAMPTLTFSIIATHVVGRRQWPRYRIVAVLLAEIVLTITLGLTHFDRVTLEFTHPVFTAPHWALSSTLSLTIPLAIVSLIGQFLPDMAVPRGPRYDILAKPIMTATSVASISVTFFGGIMIVTVAITTVLCTSKDVHDDSSRRYVVGIVNGVFYLTDGTFAGAIVMLFATLPKPLVATLAGLALIGTIASNVTGAIGDGEHRKASIITLLVTVFGLMLLRLGSTSWRIMIGSTATLVLRSAQ